MSTIRINKKEEEYQNMLSRLYPELHQFDEKTNKSPLSKTVTFQVTDYCNMACTYCYQINKGNRVMSFETAKKMVDLLISGEKGFSDYINPKTSPGIIIEFIGGNHLFKLN